MLMSIKPDFLHSIDILPIVHSLYILRFACVRLLPLKECSSSISRSNFRAESFQPTVEEEFLEKKKLFSEPSSEMVLAMTL